MVNIGTFLNTGLFIFWLNLLLTPKTKLLWEFQGFKIMNRHITFLNKIHEGLNINATLEKDSAVICIFFCNRELQKYLAAGTGFAGTAGFVL